MTEAVYTSDIGVFGARRLPFDRIPIVDLAPMFGTDRAAMLRTTAHLREVCRSIGFFYVKNHNVPRAQVDRAVEQAARFFALPLETKMPYDLARLGRHRGYVPPGGVNAGPDAATADLQEGYEIGLEVAADDPLCVAGNKLYAPNVWPAEIPGFGADLYRYFRSITELGHVLFRAFALALELPDDFFEDKIDKPMSQLRLIHYPPQDRLEDPDHIGIGAHTDYECFTMLWQSAPGLQVRNTSGDWIEAPPIPDTFVINLGDMLQRWTNDLFVSTPHRVINTTGKSRYSMPFFFGANYDAVVEPLPNYVGPSNPPRYPPTKCGYWTEHMHTLAYTYRRHERGKLPSPELR